MDPSVVGETGDHLVEVQEDAHHHSKEEVLRRRGGGAGEQVAPYEVGHGLVMFRFFGI